MANYTKHLDDLKDVLRVYYEENGEIVEIGTDTEVNPYYTVDYNTKIVSVFNLDDFTPKIDYTSTDAQDNVELDLNAIGAVDVNSVMNNGLPTGYTIEDGKIIVDSVQAGDSISVNYDLERIKIGALEYEDGDKTKNPILYGMRIRNSQGENVFTTDDKGDIHMTGTVNARAGNFSGNVLVGNEEDKYIVLSTELEDEPVIASSDYVNNRNQGWVINGSGDAIFNNITARGAIKTAVFEYEEIEAVGGAFLFRPSSTIRNAWIENPIEETVTAVISESTCTWTLPEDIDLPFTITVYSSDLEDFTNVTIDSGLNVVVFNEQSYNFTYYDLTKTLTTSTSALETLSSDIIVKSTGANLIVEVEKPQFKTGDWVKLDNFKDGDATTASGLAAIYEVEQYSYVEDGVVVVEDPTRLILIGAAEYYFDNPEDLIGGALISLGGNDDNYGIGINSGDGDIILPPRAISLFESTINPEANPKVSFDYTGILGTLPEIKDGQLPLDVDEDIYENMGGTQGIYTNNMYIGDANQYVAFYEESNEKVLDIAAGSISVGMGDYDPLYLIGDQYGVALYRGEKVDSTRDIGGNNLFIDDESLSLRNGQTPIFKAKEEEIKYKDYSYTYDVSYRNNQEIDLTNWDYTSQTYSGQRLLDGVVTQNGTYNLFIDIYPFIYYENIHYIGYLTLTKDVEYYIYQADPEHYSEPIITSEKIEGSEYTVGCGIKYIKNENKLIIYNLNYYPSYSVLNYSETTISSKIIEQNASLSLGANHEFLKGGVAIGYNNKILDENGVAIGSNLLVRNNQIVLGNFNAEDDSVVKEYNLDLSAITTIPQITINNIILYNVCFRSVDISDIVLDEEQNLKVGNLTFVLGDGPEQSNYEYYTLPISLNAAKIIGYEDSYRWKWALEFNYTNSKYKAAIYYNPSYVSDNWFLEKIYYNNNYIFSIGNGYNNSFRSNALAVDIFGNLTIGKNLIMGDNEFYVNSDHGGRFVLGKEDTYHSNYINYSTEGEYLNNISFANDGRFVFNRVPWSDAIMDHDWSQSTAVWDVDMTKVLSSGTIKGIEWSISTKTYTNQTSAAWEYIQYSIAVPNNHIYLVSFSAGWSNGRPEGIGFHSASTLNPNNVNPNFAVALSGVITAPVFMLNPGTWYAFIKRNGTNNSNTSTFRIFDITLG